MAASKVNYIVLYKGHSQVYGCSSKKIALESPPPEGFSIKDKKILFITFEPDTDNLSVYEVPKEEILSAELKDKKEKKAKDE
jgi:hypothetical protein